MGVDTDTRRNKTLFKEAMEKVDFQGRKQIKNWKKVDTRKQGPTCSKNERSMGPQETTVENKGAETMLIYRTH